MSVSLSGGMSIFKRKWIKKILVCIRILNGRAMALVDISLSVRISIYVKLKLMDMAISEDGKFIGTITQLRLIAKQNK